MTSEDVLKRVMSEVFEVEVNSISADCAADNFEKWNSMGHMKLIMRLEDELSVTFTEDEIINCLSFQELLKAVENK